MNARVYINTMMALLVAISHAGEFHVLTHIAVVVLAFGAWLSWDDEA